MVCGREKKRNAEHSLGRFQFLLYFFIHSESTKAACAFTLRHKRKVEHLTQMFSVKLSNLVELFEENNSIDRSVFWSSDLPIWKVVLVKGHSFLFLPDLQANNILSVKIQELHLVVRRCQNLKLWICAGSRQTRLGRSFTTNQSMWTANLIRSSQIRFRFQGQDPLLSMGTECSQERSCHHWCIINKHLRGACAIKFQLWRG